MDGRWSVCKRREIHSTGMLDSSGSEYWTDREQVSEDIRWHHWIQLETWCTSSLVHHTSQKGTVCGDYTGGSRYDGQQCIITQRNTESCNGTKWNLYLYSNVRITLAGGALCSLGVAYNDTAGHREHCPTPDYVLSAFAKKVRWLNFVL